MIIDKAKALKRGQSVSVPEDRGAPAYRGTVVGVGSEISQNIHGTEFVWVSVRGVIGESVWPSNRLGG